MNTARTHVTVGAAEPSVFARLLTPLSVAALAWMVYFTLTGTITDTEVSSALLAVPTCFGWTGVFSRLGGAGRPVVATLAAWLAFTMVGATLVAGSQFLGIDGDPVRTLAAQQIGAVTGVALWWLAGQRLLNWRGTRPGTGLDSHLDARTTWLTLLVLLAISLLLPLDAGSPSTGPAPDALPSSLGQHLSHTPQRFYALYKVAMLWAPVGLLFALAGFAPALRRWTVAGAAAFVLQGPAVALALSLADVVEVIGAVLGIWVGSWIGERVLEETPVTIRATGTNPGPITARPPSPPAAQPVPQNPDPGLRAAPLAGMLVVLLAAAWGVTDFPVASVWLAAGLLLYLALLLRHGAVWLLVVPAALPLMNLAPLSGRFFLDEFDLLMLVTIAGSLWHAGRGRERPPPWRIRNRFLLLAFSVSYGISLLMGLLPLETWDHNSFASYYSRYNALRVGKGLLWGLVLFALWRRETTLPPGGALRLFAVGTGAGLLGVVLVGLWERSHFAGLFDFSETYRIVATFSSMHTGGGHIEAYLVTAIPFLWLFLAPGRNPVVRVAAFCLLLAAVFVTTTTVARGGVLALAVVAAVLVAGTLRHLQHSGRLSIRTGAVLATGVAITGAIAAMGVSGEFFQRRLADVRVDLQTRLDHWSEAISVRDDGVTATLFGTGLGRFPINYFLGNVGGVLPGTYRYQTASDGNNYLRLGAGETLYVAQRVSPDPGSRHTLTLDLRSTFDGARLDVPLCERHLLNSFRCEWQSVRVPESDGQWHRQTLTIDTGHVGSGGTLARRPVELTLYNAKAGTLVDVDNVSLLDSAGNDMIRNGNFDAGGDRWFFKTHSHLPWHIKNLWVQVLFEQGWLGLIVFCLLLAVGIWRLGAGAWHGHLETTVVLAAVSGFLTVGLFGSLFDAPRLATLFFTVLLCGAFLNESPAPPPRPGAVSRA